MKQSLPPGFPRSGKHIANPITRGKGRYNVVRRELGFAEALFIAIGHHDRLGYFIDSRLTRTTIAFLCDGRIGVVGGALSIFGTMVLGEPGAAFPGTGGPHVYLRHAYSRWMAFLCGWSLLTGIHTGGIATLAFGFAFYLVNVAPISGVGCTALTQRKLLLVLG